MSRTIIALSLVLSGACSAGGGEAPDATLIGADGGGDRADGGSGMGDGGGGGGGGDAGAPDDRDAGTGMDGGSRPDDRVCETEQCLDGLDNDCDMVVDEGCACEPGESAACFRGDPRRRGQGECRDGTYLCEGSFEFGTWGACEGDILESDEVCDEAGLDEDCDGAANEDCDCVEGDPPLPCGTDQGECVSGTQLCVAGRRTDCEGSVGPNPEICNNLDDDCDGIIDEFVRRPCGIDEGICRRGTEACDAGEWGECTGGARPTDEICNGLDDDCDGEVDESATGTCGMDVGRCVTGTLACVEGSFGECEGRVDPVAETCNGDDDDCDGETDESITRDCGSTDLGVCEYGRETCTGGGWGSCVGAIYEGTETCDGSLDEDCDGLVDEGCACTDGATRPCGTDEGECVAGEELCRDGAWGACNGRVDAVAESCNNADDDCDGRTDEGVTRRCGTTDLGVCEYGRETCSEGAFGGCEGAVLPQPAEICDGLLDENCNGAVDEGCDCTDGDTRRCGTDVGICVRGTEACRDGAWAECAGAVNPLPAELCNGDDDDCDGEIDENLTETCGVTSVGVCQLGTRTCTAGEWGSCSGNIDPGVEECDANMPPLDENCDGTPNEGCACTAGETQACGETRGSCEAGEQTCQLDGTWGPCVGGVGPGTETCDGILDENCNGEVDEGCECITGRTRTCGTDVGACEFGLETCDAEGRWGPCLGANNGGVETCNDIDDDCDMNVDEMLTRVCGTGAGACSTGTQTCASGSWGTCDGEVGPGDEVCDAARIDEDCDGFENEGCLCDEGDTQSCGSDVGACVAGTQTCDITGTWGDCVGAIGESPETCNDTDDDCDTRVDEELTRVCGRSTGVCVQGTETCSAGTWGTCEGEVGPGTELCDANMPPRDENCDGTSNEGCVCVDGETKSCGTDEGECVAGTETCDLSGTWGACEGAVGGTDESCNGLDDDCDMGVDEGGVCVPPTVMCPGAATVEVGESAALNGSGSDPDGGSVGFAWSVVASPLGSTATPSPADDASTTFTPDFAGEYTLRLCVTDDEDEVSCCTVTVTATSSCVPPTPPTLTTCGTSWDRRPILEFAPLPAGLTYELYSSEDPMMPYGVVDLDGQNYYRPASELSAGYAPPLRARDRTTLWAVACLESDPMCCATSETVEVELIEACTTPTAPSPDTVIFSEYVIDGDGMCSGPDCEAGEAIEITNLSHCPVSLDGHHFSYCNTSSCSAFRWMNFGAADVIPPRGVYVLIRNFSGSSCSYPFFGTNDPSLFGLNISALEMESDASLASGWFANSNSGTNNSQLRIASGAWSGSMTSGTTIDLIAPYSLSADSCESIGFDAYDACGDVSAVSTPTDVLAPTNQLGRLWRPCDAVADPVPPACE